MSSLAAAYPDYNVSWSAYDHNHVCFDEEYGIEFLPWVGVSPRLVSVNSLRPMYTVDLASSSITPGLGPWRMTDAIQSLENPQAWPSKTELIGNIKDLGVEVTVKVVIRLAKPLTEAKARGLASNPEVFLFAPRGDDVNPISWDLSTVSHSCAGRRGFDFCQEAQSAVASFQKWVSLLHPSDNSALGIFGLSLSELQEQAADVRIHGIIVQDSPEVILRILKEPSVASASIVDMETYK
ncbi:hypothetical protein ABT061_26440 [Streptosporangium sp. NPDC002544]|uniref:hypothetical protein n=1 Tax=Streptosporangium sp. NPDC002544 TaxID=3154538 RepID=UPI0033227F72